MIIYDLETYPNFFSCCCISVDTHDIHTFEISDRCNDWQDMKLWLEALAAHRVEMVGYNNLGFDYPIIHRLMTGQIEPNPASIYAFVEALINAQGNRRWNFIPWPSDRLIPQIDLFKIHHFDNQARRTSLKALQFAMRSESVEDLPIAPGTHLTPQQMDDTRRYGEHDVLETRKFFHHSEKMIQFRRNLDMEGDKLNWSDKKIGEQMLAQTLGRSITHHWSDAQGRSVPRQTPRQSIALGDLIFPYIRFDRVEFQRVRDWLAAQVITETKGVFDDVHATLDSFRFDFGTGGIHGSVERRAYHHVPGRSIVDVDVTSLYPSIAIVNNLAPAHLGHVFGETYASMKRKRLEYAKGTPENGALKLALNGAYGDSNNKYSFLYDPQFTMQITINGQLMLCMLAERLHSIPGVELIQINTDGVTATVEDAQRPVFDAACQEWEALTRLDLESVEYRHMWIRDVNNYIAETMSGDVKRKGAYVTDRAWHQDASALVVPRAAEAAMRHGVDPADFIACHSDPFDFMLRQKTQRGDVCELGGVEQQKTLRYYIAHDGEPLAVRRPPVEGKRLGDYKKKNGVTDAEYDALNVTGIWDERIHTANKSVYEERNTSLNKGFLVAECNRADRFDWHRLDRSYYVEKARELIIDG